MTLKLHPFLQQREIANYCKANGIIVQAYCPIIRGESHPDIDAIAKKVYHSKIIPLYFFLIIYFVIV